MSKNKPTLTLKPQTPPTDTAPDVDQAAIDAAAEQARKDQEAAEAQRLADEQAAALAAANQGDEAQQPQADKPEWELGDEVLLVPVHGQPLHHLLTGVVFGAEPTPAEIDAFIALQLRAGKLAIHSDN